MKNKIKNFSILNIFAFLIGLLSATDVVYCFTIGTTNIAWTVILAVICDLYCAFVLYRGKMINIFAYVPKMLELFYICIVISIIPAILFSASYLSRWVTGLIFVLLLLALLMAIYYLKEFMNSLMIGIEVGIIVNFFLVMYEWYQYLHGNIYRSFILTRYFPNAKVQSAYMSNAFRGIGLFSEPGHLARYLAVFILVTFGWFFNKNKKNAILILLLGSITIATTRSTVIVYYLIGIFAIILINSNNSKKTFLTTVVLMVFGIFSLYLAINYIPILHSLWELFSYGFIDLSTAILGQDNSSAIRQEGMKSAVELIKEYPIIGVGWNEFTTHMIMEGYYTESVRGSYSALLQMLAQIGIGTFTYVLFIINNAIDRIRTHDIKQACFGVALLVYFVIFSTTDFGYKDSVAILFGILTVYIGDENYDYYENTV